MDWLIQEDHSWWLLSTDLESIFRRLGALHLHLHLPADHLVLWIGFSSRWDPVQLYSRCWFISRSAIFSMLIYFKINYILDGWLLSIADLSRIQSLLLVLGSLKISRMEDIQRTNFIKLWLALNISYYIRNIYISSFSYFSALVVKIDSQRISECSSWTVEVFYFMFMCFIIINDKLI